MAPTDPTDHDRMRAELARKGMEVNEKLTRLLAGQDTTMATVKLPQEQKPGEKPVEKLRRFLDQIIRAQRRLGTQAWGRCATCGVDLPSQALADAPWVEQCATCAARNA